MGVMAQSLATQRGGEGWLVKWFLWREENRTTRRKTPGERREATTNSIHMRRRVRESNPGHRGGRRALIHCANHAPPKEGGHHSACKHCRDVVKNFKLLCFFYFFYFYFYCNFLGQLCAREKAQRGFMEPM